MKIKKKDEEKLKKIKLNYSELVIVPCKDKKTKKPVSVLCWREHNDEGVLLHPLARFFRGNANDEVVPPARYANKKLQRRAV